MPKDGANIWSSSSAPIIGLEFRVGRDGIGVGKSCVWVLNLGCENLRLGSELGLGRAGVGIRVGESWG